MWGPGRRRTRCWVDFPDRRRSSGGIDVGGAPVFLFLWPILSYSRTFGERV